MNAEEFMRKNENENDRRGPRMSGGQIGSLNSLVQRRGCTPMGAYTCQVPMPIAGRIRGIDFCIADIVAALNAANITTVASCCGHGKEELARIDLEDGRVLRVEGHTPRGPMSPKNKEVKWVVTNNKLFRQVWVDNYSVECVEYTINDAADCLNKVPFNAPKEKKTKNCNRKKHEK